MVLNVAPKVADEKATHRFAGTLLMPAEILRAEVGKQRSVHGLGANYPPSSRFSGVSVQALTDHCEDLEILGNILFQGLFGEFSRRCRHRPPRREP